MVEESVVTYDRIFFSKGKFVKRVSGNGLVVLNWSALDISMLYHFVRKDLPVCFPSLEQFEALLEPSLISEAKQNFDDLLHGKRNGSNGTIIPLVEERKTRCYIL